MGHEVSLVTGDSASSRLDQLSFVCRTIPEETRLVARKIGLDYFNPRALLAFKRIAKEINPDIIHFHSLYGLSSSLVRSGRYDLPNGYDNS